MEQGFFVAVIIWPLAGVIILYGVGRIGFGQSRRVLPSAKNISEVLARMYLWPLILWKIFGRK